MHIIAMHTKMYAGNAKPKRERMAEKMNKKNFYVGMGMGLIVGGCAAYAMRPKKRCVKSVVGKTLKTMGEVADSISDAMGW